MYTCICHRKNSAPPVSNIFLLHCILTTSVSSCTPKNGHTIALKIIGDDPSNAGVTRLSPTASPNGNKWSSMGTIRDHHTIAISNELRDAMADLGFG